MRHLIKKISMLLLVISLGWFPIQVTFAASFILSNSHSASVNPQNNTTQNQHAHRRNSISQLSSNSPAILPTIIPTKEYSSEVSLSEKPASHCDMHEKGSNCCSDKASCGQMEQDCGHCFNYVAMLHGRDQTVFLAIYVVQNSYAHTLAGITNISAYRPPRFSL